MSASTKVPAFALLHHIPLFVLICVLTFSDVILFFLLRHCHTRTAIPPKLLPVFCLPLPCTTLWILTVPPFVCISLGPGSPAVYSTGRSICVLFQSVRVLILSLLFFLSLFFCFAFVHVIFGNPALVRNLRHSSLPYHYRIQGSQLTSEKTYVAGSQSDSSNHFSS